MGLLLTFSVLLLTQTSCSSSPPRPAIKVSPHLLEATTTPSPPRGDYMQDAAAEYVLGLKRGIAACNADKAALASVLFQKTESRDVPRPFVSNK